MENQKIELLFKLVIDDLVITESLLLKNGYTKKEIKELTDMGMIQKQKKKIYKFTGIEKLRQYGVRLLLTNQLKEANICFRKCYELAPNGKNVCLQVLLSAIVRNDYQEAFKIFADLEKIHPEKNIKDNNLYLYLLSILSECNEEYQERVKSFTEEDLILPHSNSNKLENDIRIAIVQNKFKYAYQLLNKLIAKDTQYSVKFELIRGLLSQAIERQKELRENLLNLAKNGDYNAIFSILNSKSQNTKLSTIEACISEIAKNIITITQNKTIPPVTNETATEMKDAILGNNFKLALRINREFLNFINASEEDDIINILLVKLNGVIEELEQEPTVPETIITPGSQEETTFVLEDELKDIQDLAYYIKESKYLTFEEATKKLGILPETVLLIKLVYARDYYTEENYTTGDKLVSEVEYSFHLTDKISQLLNQIKTNRDSYHKQLKPHTKRLIEKV